MYDQILAVAKAEWRCQVKSWFFWIGLLIIISVPLVVDLPSSAADILTPKSAGICYSIGIVMMKETLQKVWYIISRLRMPLLWKM